MKQANVWGCYRLELSDKDLSWSTLLCSVQTFRVNSNNISDPTTFHVSCSFIMLKLWCETR